MEYPNWFEPYARPMFEKHLLPLAGRHGLRFLQIGAFTGDASVWLAENVLTGWGSTLTDVDTWQGSDEPEHEPFDWQDVRATYLRKTRPPVNWWRGTSRDFFARNHLRYDFIYIDGDHTPYGVLNDAVDAYRALKSDGLLAFDDYKWTSHKTGVGPRLAVDSFAKCFEGRLQLIQLGAQAWFRRIA